MLALTLAACATLSPPPDPRAAELQAMGDVTAKAYKKWFTPRVIIGVPMSGAAAYPHQGLYRPDFYVSPNVLTPSGRGVESSLTAARRYVGSLKPCRASSFQVPP